MDSKVSQSQSDDNEAKRVQEEERMRDVLATILDTAARERLSRIALVSPERSKQIETIIIQMAQNGQLRGRVSEEQLIGLLDQMEDAQGKGVTKRPKIIYQRRKGLDDDFDI